MFKLIAIEDVQHAGEERVVCLHWAGCAKPRHPTAADLRDCEEWQAEKRARRNAEERAP